MFRLRPLLFTLGIIACAFLAKHSMGQGGLAHVTPADTMRVQALLDQSRDLKPGPAKAKLDSALQLARAIYPLLSGIARINLLATMVDAHLSRPHPAREDLDSAQQYTTRLLSLLDTLRDPSCLSDAFITIANDYREAGDKKRSLQLWARGFRLLRSLGDIVTEGQYGYKMTDWYWPDSATNPVLLPLLEEMAADEERLLPQRTAGEQFSAISDLAKAGNGYYLYKQTDIGIHFDSLAIRINQRLGQHNALPWFILSYIYSAQGRTREGLTAALDALRIDETGKGPVDGAGYEAAAKIYFVTGDFDKSMEYFNMALALFEKKPSLIMDIGGLFYRAIQIRLQQHQPAEGLRLLRLLRQHERAISLNYRTNVFFDLSTGNCYAALGRNDSAEDAYLHALSYLPARAWSVEKTSIYYNLATFYTDTRQYAKARPVLDALTADSIRAQTSFTTLETAHLLLYRVDSALRNYPRAMADLRRYQTIHDSLINVAKNKQLAEMNVQFETEKKNQHIVDLEKQNALQARLQQATIRQDRIIRNSLIGGAVLLALLAAGLYRRYRIKQWTNRVINASNQELQQLSARQQKLIREKEWLLREIHHRVKNNLQIVIGLLHLQSEQIKDEIAVSAFEDISARINSISLVHKKLYLDGQNMATVDMRDYVSEMAWNLRKSLCRQRDIHIAFDVSSIFLDVSQSVPIGLILNEAITNSFKYAFPGEAVEFPEIHILLREETEGLLELAIADNGVGLPLDFDLETSCSLGMRLINSMAMQLEGALSLTNCHGLNISIRFQRAESMSIN